MNKKHIAFFLAILINLTSMNAQKLKTEVDSVSYCIGVNIGENLKNQFSDIDIKDFITESTMSSTRKANLKYPMLKHKKYYKNILLNSKK